MNIDERIALWKSLPRAPVDETDGFIEILITVRDRLKAELESEKKESAYWRNIEAKILATDLVAVRSQLSVAKEALKAIEQCADDGYECGGGAYQRSLAKAALQKLGETGGTK